MGFPEETENEDREPVVAEDEGGVTVDVSGDDEGGDDDQGGEEQQPAARGKKQTREERKAARGRLRQENDQLRQQQQELTARTERLENALNQAISGGRREQDQHRQQGDGRQDQTDAELESVYEEMQGLSAQVEALGNKITPQQLQTLTKRYRQLDARKHELIAERVAARNAPREDPTSRMREALRFSYSDVYAKPSAVRWAQGWFHMQVAKGREAGPDLVRESLDEARKEFGMGRAAPTDQQRARFTGVSRGGTGAGAAPTTKVTLTKSQMKMADTAYGHVKDKNVRYQMWAKKAGKRLAEKKRASS